VAPSAPLPAPPTNSRKCSTQPNRHPPTTRQDPCSNFLYAVKGTPSARQAGPGPAEIVCRDAEVSPGEFAIWSESAPAQPGGQQGSRPPPGRQPAAPYGRKPTGRGAASRRQPPRPQVAGIRSNAHPVTVPAQLTGPPSPRRAFCRPRQIPAPVGRTGQTRLEPWVLGSMPIWRTALRPGRTRRRVWLTLFLVSRVACTLTRSNR
jgi:hypothetical protein